MGVSGLEAWLDCLDLGRWGRRLVRKRPVNRSRSGGFCSDDGLLGPKEMRRMSRILSPYFIFSAARRACGVESCDREFAPEVASRLDGRLGLSEDMLLTRKWPEGG